MCFYLKYTEGEAEMGLFSDLKKRRQARQMEQRIVVQSLKEANLSEDQITVLYLRVHRGMTIEQAAKTLHMAVGTVTCLDNDARRRVAQAKERVLKHIGKE
jgi:DNA-directed RNA polymerase specialized sigma24 family protein